MTAKREPKRSPERPLLRADVVSVLIDGKVVPLERDRLKRVIELITELQAQQGEPPPSDGAASSPTSAAAKGRGIRGSSTGSKNR